MRSGGDYTGEGLVRNGTNVGHCQIMFGKLDVEIGESDTGLYGNPSFFRLDLKQQRNQV